MKILVFEDEYDGIKTNLDAINLLYYDNEIEFVNLKTSQELNISEISDYSLIMVDIDLSENSEKDGLFVINEIKTIDENKPIIIITGSSNIDNYHNVPIVIKPLKFKEVYSVMRELLEE